MTDTTAHRTTLVAAASPSTPRVSLAPTRAGVAVLDGGWWPRSYDPAVELPGLVLALGERYGPIRQLMLNSAAWDTRFHRLAVGSRRVRMGWFTSLHAAVAVATTEHGDQVDLLVVPPGTAEGVAQAALARSADPANTLRAPDILADTP